VLNQCFTLDFEDRLAGETGGLISGRDDCDGVLEIQAPHTATGILKL